MTEIVYRIIGIFAAVLGTIFVLLPVVFAMLWITGTMYAISPPSMYVVQTAFTVMTGIFLLGIVVSYAGISVIKTKQKETLFLAKDGGPIHSCKRWTRNSEQGLYLTSCGLVVSTNQESVATAHVGYRIIPAKHATHRDCVEKNGRLILEAFTKHRSW